MALMNLEHDAAPTDHKKLLLVITERDIVFICPACHGELVVDLAGAGLEVPCSHCGQTLTVPAHTARPATAQVGSTLHADAQPESTQAPARHFDFSNHTPEQMERRVGELKHQLKENRSQDT